LPPVQPKSASSGLWKKRNALADVGDSDIRRVKSNSQRGAENAHVELCVDIRVVVHAADEETASTSTGMSNRWHSCNGYKVCETNPDGPINRRVQQNVVEDRLVSPLFACMQLIIEVWHFEGVVVFDVVLSFTLNCQTTFNSNL
jgi:hypothetical protein